MQNVGIVKSPSPDIVLIPAQGRDSEAVHQDIQKARAMMQAAKNQCPDCPGDDPAPCQLP